MKVHGVRSVLAGIAWLGLLAACGGGGPSVPPPPPALAAPTALSYSSPVQVDVGQPLPTLTPTVTGTVTGYTVSPALPRGITLDPASGAIRGTPLVSADSANYRITASNAGGSTAFDWSLRVRTSFGAPVPLSYRPFFVDDPAYPYAGQPVNLFAWEGRNVAVLTRRSDLNPGTMELLVAAVDRGYDFYVNATGRAPITFRHYNGKLSIADVQRTCGAGCGYLGFTGIEADSAFFDQIYAAARDEGLYGSFLFYELGRNFWFYDPEIAYRPPTLSAPVVTGFAVVNWWWSMESAGVKMPVDGCSRLDHDALFNHVSGVIDTYVANAALNWDTTLAVNRGVADTGCAVDAPALFASILLRVARDHGGLPFATRLWREVDARPDAATNAEALDNLVLAASLASGRNLTRIFADTWRWPVSDAARTEALALLGQPW